MVAPSAPAVATGCRRCRRRCLQLPPGHPLASRPGPDAGPLLTSRGVKIVDAGHWAYADRTSSAGSRYGCCTLVLRLDSGVHRMIIRSVETCVTSDHHLSSSWKCSTGTSLTLAASTHSCLSPLASRYFVMLSALEDSATACHPISSPE